MIQIHLLEDFDIIKPDDLCRQLELDYDGQSDHLIFTSPYSGTKINRLGWLRAKNVCPYWIGKTVGDFNSKLTSKSNHHKHSPYEFVRGNIPLSHMEPM